MPDDRIFNPSEKFLPDRLFNRNMIGIRAEQSNIFLRRENPRSVEQGIANIGKAILFRNHRPSLSLFPPVFLGQLLLGPIEFVIILPIERFNFFHKGGLAFIAVWMVGKPGESTSAFQHGINFGVSDFLRYPVKS